MAESKPVKVESLKIWGLLDAIGSADVTVGLHEEDGGRLKAESTVAQLAYWNEFGTSNIPARAAYRQYADSSALTEAGRALLRDLARATDATGAQSALGDFGTKLAQGLWRHVDSFSNPPNAPYTIKKKGFNDPLVETGQTRDSIAAVIWSDGKRARKIYARR